MRTAIYPGSFNPFHEGHLEVIKKACHIFDKIVICQMINLVKPAPEYSIHSFWMDFKIKEKIKPKITTTTSNKMLRDEINSSREYSAIIKGIRNGIDFEYEKMQQYWNEDLGIVIPTVYIIAGRTTSHISSSAIRQIQPMEKT